jgi:hypothetical protein
MPGASAPGSRAMAWRIGTVSYSMAGSRCPPEGEAWLKPSGREGPVTASGVAVYPIRLSDEPIDAIAPALGQLVLGGRNAWSMVALSNQARLIDLPPRRCQSLLRSPPGSVAGFFVASLRDGQLPAQRGMATTNSALASCQHN